ncbi:unnamed protein product [Scytosiphon promiscuus]
MFAQPVTTAIAANYFQIVKEPMDLKTMGQKVQAGQYRTLQEMRDDCELMSKNALLFNRAPGEVSVASRSEQAVSFKLSDDEELSACSRGLNAPLW